MAANPVVGGDTVYLQDMASNGFALDRATGGVRWRHDYSAPTAGGNGVALGHELTFGAIGLSAEAFALRAESGDEVWRVKLTVTPNEFIFMQPLVYDNVVYVATSPGAYVGGTRGILFALDAKTGGVLWQWDTTTDNLWGNARLNAGGGVWYPPSVDEAGNIYFGTGNPAPWPEIGIAPEASSRPGPNLYTSSMVSLDTRTGSLRWYVQARPHDQLDHDFQHTPVLATVTIAGTPTKLAIGAGPFGGVLSPIAFANETVYVPVVNAPLSYSETGSDLDLAHATGEMVAQNAVDGTVRWSTKVDTFFCGAATVANDVVFGAGLDGVVRGFETETGREVWRYRAGAGINAPPAIAGGALFVPVGAPLITSAATPPPATRNGLIAFRLGAGTAVAATPATG